MRKSVGVFWCVVAMLYGVLAGLSYHYGAVYDQKIAKAPTMQATAGGGTKFVGPSGSITLASGSGAEGDTAITDVWKDLRAYLNASTWVSIVGFVLAAAAAGVSFWSSRSNAH